MDNYIEMKLPAVSKNEAFARNAIAAFCVELNPTVEEVNDIKTAVSEAVTNCTAPTQPKDNGGNGGTVYDNGNSTGTSGDIYNYDNSTKNTTQNITVTIQNYAAEVDTDKLVREINMKLAEAM